MMTKNTYKIPDGKRIYAIGDIHGEYHALKNMHLAIDMHLNDNPPNGDVVIVYLGDYVDRGPDNDKVLDVLSSLAKEETDIERVFIKGNHEVGVLGFMDDPLSYGAAWLKYGGVQTLKSYGIETHDNEGSFLPAEFEYLADSLKDKLPKAHRDFMKNTVLYHVEGDYFFTHAGVRPDVSLLEQSSKDLTFIREPFLSYEGMLEKRIVHGHTISKEPEILAHRVGLDTGAYKHGVLTAGIFENTKVDIIQANNEEF